jgi:ABC-type antimicrobial peptide transport system permease subunit
MADADYFATYQMSFLAGGSYAPSDSGSGFVVNESFVRQVGADFPGEVIGKYVTLNDLELPIVGVVEDYHSNTFGTKIPSLLIANYSPWYNYLNLKVNMSQASAVVAQLETLWRENYPDFPFKYSFLDDTLAGFYVDYQRLLALTQLFSGLAIAIGCLGLYGLVLFMAEQRTKEIGIRKVLGASVRQLLMLFSGEFIKLVLIAFCLAAPLAYYLMQHWLQSFVYRVDIGFAIFGGCLLITLLLVLITVGYRSTRAALANPVDSLRNE